MSGLSTAKKLREDRARDAARMNEIVAAPAGENGQLSAEQRAEFDRIHAAQEAKKADIDRLERLEAVDADLAGSAGRLAGGRPTGDEDEPETFGWDLSASDDDDDSPASRSELRTYAKRIAVDRAKRPRLFAAYDAYLRRGMNGLNGEQRAIMEKRFALPGETRAQSIAVDTAGGYLVPEGFFNAIVEARSFFGGMRQSRATIVPTSTGNQLPIPTDNDTSNTGELVGENNALSSQDVTFGQKMLNAYTYSSKIIKVSRALLNDSAFPLQPFIARKFGQRIGRIQNTHFTTGDAASKPEGVVTGATSGVSGASGQTTSFIYNDFVDLEHSVNRDYRENAEWMMHDSGLKVAKKMKDGEGRPLWVPGLALRQPDSILGYRYIVNNDVAAPAASAKSMLFGDFSNYFIRDVQEILVLRLDERYADNLQVGFLAFARGDGKLVDAGTNPIKYFEHAAS